MENLVQNTVKQAFKRFLEIRPAVMEEESDKNLTSLFAESWQFISIRTFRVDILHKRGFPGSRFPTYPVTAGAVFQPSPEIEICVCPYPFKGCSVIIADFL